MDILYVLSVDSWNTLDETDESKASLTIRIFVLQTAGLQET